MNLKGVFLSDSPDWRTPAFLYANLDAEFGFDDYPCPHQADNPDGLLRDWGRRVFVNPPYGRQVWRWLDKALGELRKRTELVVFLLPARTDTRWFHDYVLPHAREIRFLRGRLHFSEAGPAPFPSMVVIFQ